MSPGNDGQPENIFLKMNFSRFLCHVTERIQLIFFLKIQISEYFLEQIHSKHSCRNFHIFISFISYLVCENKKMSAATKGDYKI